MSPNQKFAAKHAACTACPFATLGKPIKPVLARKPDANTPTRGVVVGEYPSLDDSEEGAPFVGVTGKSLNEKLEAAGILRRELVILHACACRPHRGATDDDIGKAVRQCRGLFLKQLEDVPSAIPTLALGKWAAIAITGSDKSPMASRGYIQPTRLPRKP